MDKNNINYNLYLVTDRNILGDRNLYDSIEEAIQGGVSIVQLREKSLSSLEFYIIAKKVKEITDKYDIPLIINDRLDIALAVDAHGLHLGPDDLPITVARKILGPDKIIGASTCNIQEAANAQKAGADYLGVGAIFPTSTKKNTDDVSIEDLKKIKASVEIPVVAIGGINQENAPSVMEAEIDGIAVVSSILGKDNILKAAKSLYKITKK